jgi:nucleoside-diphosphate-sugar epimerase
MPELKKEVAKDLEQNTIATFNVLEAMRANDIRRIAFSSTGSIYGEPDVFPRRKPLRFLSRLRCTAHPNWPEKG